MTTDLSLTRRSTMKLAGVGALAAIVAGTSVHAGAQEGTPPAAGFEIAPGVMAEALAFAAGQEAPSLYRLTFAPGVTYLIAPAPELSLVYAETGILQVTLDAPVSLTRAGSPAAPGEVVSVGDTFTLAVGDYTVLPPLVGGEVRNAETEAASVLVAAILVADGIPSAATPVT